MVSLTDIYATLLALFLVGLVVLVHYESLQLMYRWFGGYNHHRRGVLFTMFGLLIAHTVEIWIYGLGYWACVHWLGWGTIEPAFTGWLDCIYFSAMVYTTVGFGDLIPMGSLRMVVSAEALSGLALITWSASFTFLQMQRLWKR